LKKIKKISFSTFRKIIWLKIKFAFSSLFATGVDYFLYLFLVNGVLPPVSSHIVSNITGILINFFVQKKFVFELQRTAMMAFVYAMAVSGSSLLISSSLLFGLNHFSFFSERTAFTKLLLIGLMFFYHFYFKRFAFEKKFLGLDEIY